MYYFVTGDVISTHTLSDSELEQWQEFCRARLSGEQKGAPLNISDYINAHAQLTIEQQIQPAVQAWYDYVLALRQRYQV